MTNTIILNKNIFNGDVLLAKKGLAIREELLNTMLSKGIITFDDYVACNPNATDRQKAKAFLSHSIGETIPCAPDEIKTYVTKLLDNIVDSDNSIAKSVGYLSGKTLWSYKHSLRVAVIAAAIAKAMDMSDDLIRLIAEGSVTHDIGKMFYVSLVNKTGKLTAEEYECIKKHTVSGYNFLLKAGFRKEVAEIALYHHERRDGSGYWHMTDIPAHVEIVSLADSIDAMMSARPYKRAWTPLEVMTKLHAEQREKRVYDKHLLNVTAKLMLGC